MAINNLELNDIGQNRYDLKLSKNLAPILKFAGIRVVVESYNNGNNWYRIWSDGWIEQGGYFSSSGNYTIPVHLNFLKSFKSTTYFFCRNTLTTSADTSPRFYSGEVNGTRTLTGLDAYTHTASYTVGSYWIACGY